MQAKADRLYGDVKFLTSLDPARNYRNLKSLTKAATYISDVFTATGGKPWVQRWNARGNDYSNVGVSYNEENPRRIVVGAHYDVAGDQPGADDNASGVAGVLELARLVFASKPKLDHRIDFICYCLEEPPFFGGENMGSYIHAKSLFDQGATVSCMVCLEMIGYYSDEPGSQRYPSPDLSNKYPSTADFIAVVGIEKYRSLNEQFHRIMSVGSKIDVQVVSFPENDALSGMASLSDQRNYWKFGFPALMINDTSFVRNPHYHEPSDTIDTLDFPKMTEVVSGVGRTLINIAS